MKRLTLLTLAMCVALAGCTSGTDIGKGLVDPGTGIASASPTQSQPKVKTNKKAPKPTESAKPKIDVNTIILAVRSNDDGFEYKLPGKDWTSAFNGGPPAYPEDIIIFKNLDKEGCSKGYFHSWLNVETSQYAEGKLFNSKTLRCGKSFTWVVPNKPGEYRYKDGQIPYRDAQGPLLILPARG